MRLPIDVPPLLAVGAHQKSAVAIAVGHQVFASQHIGDLDSWESLSAFERVIGDLTRLYALTLIAGRPNGSWVLAGRSAWSARRRT